MSFYPELDSNPRPTIRRVTMLVLHFIDMFNVQYLPYNQYMLPIALLYIVYFSTHRRRMEANIERRENEKLYRRKPS